MTAVATRPAYDTCGAKTRSGGQCRRPAGWGTDHAGAGCCKLHFGATPAHGTRARRMLAMRDAARSLADVGYEPVEDPVALLADVAGRADAMSRHFADRVGELESYRYRSDQDTEQLRAELGLLRDFLLMTGKFAKDLASLGLDERLVRLAEGQADLVRDFLLAVFRSFGIDPESADTLERLTPLWPVLDGAPVPVIDVKETS